MKHLLSQLIHVLTHDLWCRTCNPLVTHQRARHTADAQAGGDMAYFRALIDQDKAAQAAKRQRLREALVAQGAVPWEVDLLSDLVDAHRQGKRVVAQIPPQHGYLA